MDEDTRATTVDQASATVVINDACATMDKVAGVVCSVEEIQRRDMARGATASIRNRCSVFCLVQWELNGLTAVSLHRPHLPAAWVCLAACETTAVGEEEAWHGVVPGAERRQDGLVRSNYKPETIFPLLRDVAGCHGEKENDPVLEFKDNILRSQEHKL